jgi:hypothetical protein
MEIEGIEDGRETLEVESMRIGETRVSFGKWIFLLEITKKKKKKKKKYREIKYDFLFT